MKRLITSLSMLALVGCVLADNITEDKARDIAAKFLNGAAVTRKAKASTSNLTLAKASYGYYAFNCGAGDGYVIVASDDNASSEVLGYADEGNIDFDNIPENLRWWLSEYDRQMQYAASHTAKANVAKAKMTTVVPLLTSKWSQDSPYNDKCPTYNGQACYSGCVATAMAQIMRHHKWPKTGTGSISYDWSVNGSFVKKISVDFSKSTYDWDAMTDTYNSSSSNSSKEAVAQLMYDVAAASQMQFSPDASGTMSLDAVRGLVKCLGYDKGLTYVLRDYYTLNEWETMLHNELAASRPFYISGCESTYTMAHAFVCDGYSDGYYHINWGWGGMSDGYFLLSALNPETQGAGGGGDGYSYDLEAVIGIQKPVDGSVLVPVLYAENDFGTVTKNATRYTNVTFTGATYYYGYEARTLTIGIKVVSASGDVTYVEGPQYTFTTYSGFNSFSVNMSDFPTANGEYKVYPAVYDNATGKWYDIRTKVTDNAVSYLVATVNGSNIKFSTPKAENAASIAVSDITMPDKLYAGKTFTVKATCSVSGGDYYGNLHLGFMTEGVSKASTYDNSVALVDCAEGESQTVTIATIAPTRTGDYSLVVLDEDGNVVSDKVAVTVQAAPTTTLSFTAQSVTMPSTKNVDPNDIEITAKVKCTGGYYYDRFYAYFFEGNNDCGYITSPLTTMVEGDEATVTIKGDPATLACNKTYTVYILYYGGSYLEYILPYIKSCIAFTTAATAGIDGIQGSVEPQDIIIYSASGAIIDRQKASTPDLSKLPKGIYVVKGKDGAKKVIKR